MLNITPDSFFFAFFLCTSLLGVAALVFFLRGLTLEYCALKSESENENLWRYGVPALVALLFNYWMNYYGHTTGWNWGYLLLTCVALPLLLTGLLLWDALERKKERIVFLTFRLFFLSATFVTTEWFWHSRDDNTQNYSGEVSVTETRDSFLVPLWATTTVLLFSSVGMWALRQDDEYAETIPVRYPPQQPHPHYVAQQHQQQQQHQMHQPQYMSQQQQQGHYVAQQSDAYYVAA